MLYRVRSLVSLVVVIDRAFVDQDFMFGIFEAQLGGTNLGFQIFDLKGSVRGRYVKQHSDTAAPESQPELSQSQ